MSIVYENYLIILSCVLALFFAAKYVLSLNLVKREREYFIKTLSHDLRVSVIAQIRGLELLNKTMTNSQSELFNELDLNCKYTLDMISMLINTYKNKNNELSIDYKLIDISHITQKLIGTFEKLAQEKGIVFNYYNESSFIMADDIWITKALQIIISTIIDLSNKCERITCTIKNIGNHIRLEFKYTGRSLTDEEYKKMFSGNTKYSTVGFGIKMHLLKNIIDIHSGKIAIQTNPAGKNAFIIILPVKKPTDIRKTSIISKLQPFHM